MNPKLILAFVLGGVAVGGVVYFTTRHSEPSPQVAATTAQPVASPAPATTAAPEPATTAAPAPVVEPKPVKKSTRRTEPVQLARTTPAPAPTPAPVQAAPPAPSRPAPAPVHVAESHPAPAPKVEPPPERKPQTVTIPAGTLISVRLRNGLSTERNSADDSFQATLDAPLIVDGMVIAEKGSVQRGRIVELARSGRVKGRAVLAVELNQLNTADGQRLDIKTDTFRREAESEVKKDALKTGAAAGIGALIGAIAGGGKGAAIGAGVGGAGGAAGTMATRGKPVDLPSETRLSFRLKESVTVTEKLN